MKEENKCTCTIKDISHMPYCELSTPPAEKVCEKNCPDFNGMSILHIEQCQCSCHPVLAKGEISAIAHAIAEDRERVMGLIDKHDPQTGKGTSPVYWGNTLRADLRIIWSI